MGLICQVRQRREAIETNKGYTGTSYKNIILPCPGFKKSTMPCPNIPLATDFSWIVKDGQIRSEHCTVPPALKLFWLSVGVDVPRDARTRFCSCKGPGTHYRVTFVMPLLEQRLRTNSKRISSNLPILELYKLYTFIIIVSAAEPRRGAPSKCRLID